MSTAPAPVCETGAVAHPFSLDSPGALWIVTSGKLDIFLAPLEAGRPIGALTHIMRVESGEAVFSLPASGDSNFGFIASPAARTFVIPQGLDDISPAELETLRAPWIRGLSAKLNSVPSPEWTFEEFHRIVPAELIRGRMRSDEEETERLAARTRADAKLVNVAIRTLAGPLGRKVAESTASNPLVAACQAVAAAAGITLRIPQSVIQGKSKDPQRAIARYSSVRSRRLVLAGDWWKHDSGPMLAFLEEGNHPVALLPRSSRSYELYDPADDSATRVDSALARKLSGIAWMYYKPFPNRTLKARDVLSAGIAGSGRDLATIAFAGLLVSILGLVAPYAAGVIFDTIIPGSERGQLVQAVALIVASAVAVSLVSITRGYALLRVTARMDFVTEAALWDRLLNLPVTFFRDYSAGDLATRSLAVSRIVNLLNGTATTAILSGLFSFTSLFLLFYYSAELGALAALLAVFSLAVTVGSGMMQSKLRLRLTASSGRIAGLVFQFIDGIAKFRVSGTEGRAFARWSAAFIEQKKSADSLRKMSGNLAVFLAGFQIISLCLIFWAVSARMNAHEGISTGSFLAFSAAFGQLMAAVTALGNGVLLVQQAASLYERARPILEALPEVDAGKADPGELTGSIEVNHLAFRYSADTPLVLRDVSFSVKAGEFVALVGGSGSGKSTLLRLLLGFEKALAGGVYFDGQDSAGLDVQEVRRQIGIVLQNGKLQPGDILTNIIGARPLTVDHAWEAARMAGMEDDIRNLPMGMYTVVAEGGRGLSGGQRQRLMIARAIVGRPRIILLDEATSALDNRTQEIVSLAMEQMRATRIVIAHRLTTVMKADRIFVLDRGVIVQTGTYDELIRQEGFFAELAKRQIA